MVLANIWGITWPLKYATRLIYQLALASVRDEIRNLLWIVHFGELFSSISTFLWLFNFRANKIFEILFFVCKLLELLLIFHFTREWGWVEWLWTIINVMGTLKMKTPQNYRFSQFCQIGCEWDVSIMFFFFLTMSLGSDWCRKRQKRKPVCRKIKCFIKTYSD